MKIYRPIKSDRKTQGWGESRACVRVSGGILNYNNVVGKKGGVCPIGYQDLYSSLGLRGHNGEDWATYHREPLYFPVDFPEAGGWFSVDASDTNGGLGIDVISKNKVTLNGRTDHIKFRFWHLDTAWKDKGVGLGEIIGYCDNTGASSGTHVHWSVKWCDENGRSLDKNNGYYGAWDFSPYFKNEFIIDYLKKCDVAVKEPETTVEQKLSKIVFSLNAFNISLRKYLLGRNKK